MPPGHPGQDPFGEPSYGGTPMYPNAGFPQPPGRQNALGLVSMLLGVASIPLVCCFPVGIPIGVAAVVTGHLGRQQADQGRATNPGQARAGLICGAIAVGSGIVTMMLRVVADLPLPTLP